MKQLHFLHYVSASVLVGTGLFACGNVPEDAGTGGGLVCRPGETRPCYEGPPGTEGVGICIPGKETCNAQGTGFGACEGQILPGTETCAEPGDEDCDGTANEDCSCIPGQKEICYTGAPETVGVGICKAGERICLPDGIGFGPCEGEVLPGPEVCFSPLDESCDGIETCEGKYTYSLAFSSVGDEALQVAHIAAMPDGRAFVVGHILDAIVVDGTTLESVGGWDVFVMAIDPKGKLLWAKRYGDLEDQRGSDIAVDAAGNVFVTGTFTGTINFGNTPLSTTGSFDTDVFVAKLDSNGNHVWSKRFGDPSSQAAGGIAVNKAGNLLLTGSFTGTVDFGKGPLTSAGSTDVFVARLASDGTAEWSAGFGDAAPQAGIRLAADANGGFYVTGEFEGLTNFGGGPLTSAGGTDIFLASFDAAGKHVRSQRYGGVGFDRGGSVALTSANEAVLTGYFGDEIDLGAGPITSTGNYDGFVTKIGVDGKAQWANVFTGVDVQLATDVTVDGAGNVLVVGTFVGPMMFGGASVVSAGVEDTFVSKMNPQGTLAWLRTFGDDQKQEGNAVAVDAKGNVFFAGRYYGAPDFGGGALPVPSGVGGFIVKLSP